PFLRQQLRATPQRGLQHSWLAARQHLDPPSRIYTPGGLRADVSSPLAILVMVHSLTVPLGGMGTIPARGHYRRGRPYRTRYDEPNSLRSQTATGIGSYPWPSQRSIGS